MKVREQVEIAGGGFFYASIVSFFIHPVLGFVLLYCYLACQGYLTLSKVWDLIGPKGAVYWARYWGWGCYPFRVLYVGFWCVSIDRSRKFWKRWPHVSITWNDSQHD